MKRISTTVLIILSLGTAWGGASGWESGGVLSTLQAAYDVTGYSLHLKIDPATRSLSGYTDIVLRPEVVGLEEIELDLIAEYTIHSISVNRQPAGYVRNEDKIFILVPGRLQKEKTITVRVYYEGQPPVAKNPPWDGGFIWSEDQNGTPWIGVSCQEEGAKIWWPCKDHPSDEPDSVNLYITVPQPLVCAANGLLVSVSQAEPGWQTWHWTTHYPTNNYSVTVNIADYVVHHRIYRGARNMDMVFYVLREDETGADSLLVQAERMLSFFVRRFGEYPWIDEKLGIAQTDYYGMEHQTIISYGNHYRNTDYGYDFLLFHEMAHEWWGNYLTAQDWADFWLHEGTAIYAEALYVEEYYGRPAYFAFMKNIRSKILNDQPLVPKRNATTAEVYSSDIYYKGAWLLHMLRFVSGAPTLDSLLYQTLHSPKGRPANQITSDDFISLAQTLTGRDLTSFFRQYLYREALPELTVTQKRSLAKTTLTLRWATEGFAFPVEIRIGKGKNSTYRTLRITNTETTLSFPGWPKITIDPHGWLLAVIR